MLNTNTITFQGSNITVKKGDLIINLKKQVDLFTNKLAALID